MMSRALYAVHACSRGIQVRVYDAMSIFLQKTDKDQKYKRFIVRNGGLLCGVASSHEDFVYVKNQVGAKPWLCKFLAAVQYKLSGCKNWQSTAFVQWLKLGRRDATGCQTCEPKFSDNAFLCCPLQSIESLAPVQSPLTGQTAWHVAEYREYW